MRKLTFARAQLEAARVAVDNMRESADELATSLTSTPAKRQQEMLAAWCNVVGAYLTDVAAAIDDVETEVIDIRSWP